LGGGQFQQAGSVVKNTSSGGLVFCEGIGGKEDKGCSSVNNTGGGGKDGVGSTVANGLVDTPELAGGRGSGDRNEGDGSSELGAVSSTPGNLSVEGLLDGGGLERDTDGVGADDIISEEVVGDGGDG